VVVVAVERVEDGLVEVLERLVTSDLDLVPNALPSPQHGL